MVSNQFIEVKDFESAFIDCFLKQFWQIVVTTLTTLLIFQGTCLCLSGQGQGTVVYCYGDPSARNLHQLGPGDLGEDETGLGALHRLSIIDLAQLAVYTLGILAM